jgi:hypothetical protein
MPAYEKPPARPVDVYFSCGKIIVPLALLFTVLETRTKDLFLRHASTDEVRVFSG